MKKVAAIIIFSNLLVACVSSTAEKKTKPNTVAEDFYWGKVAIVFNNKSYKINSNCDTLFVRKWDVKDSFVDAHTATEVNYNFITSYCVLDSTSEITFVKLVYGIIKEAKVVNSNSTCGAGNIELYFTASNSHFSCKYYSVGNWSYISPKLGALNHSLEKFNSILKPINPKKSKT
jgi:hypothetical protein